MILEKQIDRTLYTYDTKTGDLRILHEHLEPCELPHEVVRDILWAFKMLGVGQHSARIERKRIEDSQE
jgi:hypothetical protein